jgi:hypothetical protein
MKKHALILALAVSGAAQAVVYNDAAGDVAVGSFPHLDITSVEVTNTLTDITFKFSLSGDPIATNWGKYNVLMRRVGASALDTSATNNPWIRNYGLSGGSGAFLGSWVDAPNNNVQAWTFDGSSWSQGFVFTNAVDTSSVTLTASLASLGLSVGDQIVFDAVTTGGNSGDTAVDSLTGAAPSAWNELVPLQGVTYNVVPEPGTLAVLGLGLLAARRRRK